jgi:hypothetical protein
MMAFLQSIGFLLRHLLDYLNQYVLFSYTYMVEYSSLTSHGAYYLQVDRIVFVFVFFSYIRLFECKQ